jgi:hypothetical protein
MYWRYGSSGSPEFKLQPYQKKKIALGGGMYPCGARRGCRGRVGEVRDTIRAAGVQLQDTELLEGRERLE